MQVGAVRMGYPSYVYNTNRVSAKSMQKLDAIPDDALKGKVGYTGSQENTNPLPVGGTKDWAGIVSSQMAMGRMNATRIMKPAPQAEEAAASNQASQNTQENMAQAVETKEASRIPGAAEMGAMTA